MSIKTTDTDMGEKAILKEIAIADNSFVDVGFIEGVNAEDTHEESGFTMVQIGTVHEFGAPGAGIPSRSFIRSTYDREKDKIFKVATKLYDQILALKIDTKKALDKLGLVVVTRTRNTIKKQIGFKALSPVTLRMRTRIKTKRRKGAVSKALILTGQLMQSLTHHVVIRKGR